MHVPLEIPPNMSVSEVVGRLKSETSRWLRKAVKAVVFLQWVERIPRTMTCRVRGGRHFMSGEGG